MSDLEHELATVRKERLPPDPAGTAHFLSRIGYTLEEALADIIDNCIDANAKHVVVRLVRSNDRVTEVLIADDGHGMSEAELHQAMQYGVRRNHSKKDLGKYGIGLKAASNSQCKALTVLSTKNKQCAGRRWTNESIQDEWRVEILDPQSVVTFMEFDWGPISLRESGTIVLWEKLESLASARQDFQKNLQRTLRDLGVNLGLRFHRFIERGDLEIIIDVTKNLSTPGPTPLVVEPLNPFGYKETGQTGYPAEFLLHAFDHKVKAVAHIWPPKSKDPNYRLGGGNVSARQGFYFYRNDRLIKAGGWHQYKGDTEPHSSLARVMIDIPPDLDGQFHLTVQKTDFQVPPEFVDAVHEARSGNTTFAEYLKTAEKIYRKGPKEETFVLVPNEGLPSGLAKKLARQIRAQNRKGRIKGVNFRWEKMADEVFVTLDNETREILLNTEYRDIMTGGRNTGADAPLYKTLFFLLCEEILYAERISSRLSERLNFINQCLFEAVKWQK